jgi:hypothetical protein
MHSESMTAFIVIIIIVLFIAIVTSNYVNNSTTISHFTPTDISIPTQDSFQPLTYPPSSDYVYFPDDNVYLLPFDKLDFNNPFDRWMYYYYPEFYFSYYDQEWPFVGVPIELTDNVYGGPFWIDNEINRERDRERRRERNGERRPNERPNGRPNERPAARNVPRSTGIAAGTGAAAIVAGRTVTAPRSGSRIGTGNANIPRPQPRTNTARTNTARSTSPARTTSPSRTSSPRSSGGRSDGGRQHFTLMNGNYDPLMSGNYDYQISYPEFPYVDYPIAFPDSPILYSDYPGLCNVNPALMDPAGRYRRMCYPY